MKATRLTRLYSALNHWPFAARAALHALAVAALCLASVVYATGLWATPDFAVQLLVMLAVLAVIAAWALRIATRPRISFYDRPLQRGDFT